jgi:signal transduction histidine kinase
MEQLRDWLSVDMVGSWRIDARASAVMLEHSLGWPGERGAVALGHPDVTHLLPEVTRSFAFDGRAPAPGGALEEAGIRSGIVAPIQGGGRSGGSIGAFTRDRRRFSPAEIEAVAAVAELISAAQARVRLARVEGDLDIARRQASVGALVSGVAHDFNNMLSVMLGYARLMQDEAQGSEILAEGVAEIEVAARRAMGLSRSLVDLGRPIQTAPEILEVSAVVGEVGELLHRTLGDAIRLTVESETPGPKVCMTPGELDRVVVNLVANARDALPDGGDVVIRAFTAQTDEGERVAIEVIDNGIGMDPAVLGRVFEPSFTTKEKGRGSGIGLTAVDTIVRAAGGTVEFESEPGRGTKVRVILPVA